MLPTGTVVSLQDAVAHDVNTTISAVVDSRVLAGVLGWAHRNYLQQPALCGVYEWPIVDPVLAESPVTRRD